MNEDLLTVVSVDVLALTYDHTSRQVLLGVDHRATEPFLGEAALPGVVVRSGERLAAAAHRALAKLELNTAPSTLGQIRTFDEPSRDPRGPSLSIAMYATFPDIATTDGWVPLRDAGPLAFDHEDIVRQSWSVLSELLWRDAAFTRGLTGAAFSSTDAAVITESLRGAPAHRSNLLREIGKMPGLEDVGVAHASTGRPPRQWVWQ